MYESLFWYDYETSGLDPRYDRVYQFAGLRTDLQLNPIDEPINLFCQPGTETLPSPDACLITGLSPIDLQAKGLPEAEFCRIIAKEFSQAQTCVVGYNSIRFDDEFTRFLLYRNLYDPYAREWQNGNSRWDILGLTQLAFALRPDGINWPKNSEGKISLKLEDLSRANGLVHQKAHDAMSDIYATIELAKLIRSEQPRLYDFVFNNRRKQQVNEILWDSRFPAVIYCTSMVSRDNKHLAFVKPLFTQTNNQNSVVAFDLRYDPELLLGCSQEQLKRLFIDRQPDEDLAALTSALHYIAINRCPVVVPLNTISEQQLAQHNLDNATLISRSKFLQHQQQLVNDLKSIFTEHTTTMPEAQDADAALYSGGFISNIDRERMTQVQGLSAQQLANTNIVFNDQRFNELLFRYRARNFPETLDANEQLRWQQYRRQRLMPESIDLENQTTSAGPMSWTAFNARVNELLGDGDLSQEQRDFIMAIKEYAHNLVADIS